MTVQNFINEVREIKTRLLSEGLKRDPYYYEVSDSLRKKGGAHTALLAIARQVYTYPGIHLYTEPFLPTQVSVASQS